MRVDLVTPAGQGEVLSVEKAKAFARVTHASEDGLFVDWIHAAVDYAEGRSRRRFLVAEFELAGAGFASLARETGGSAATGCIVLYPAPLVDVVSVTYTDVDGVDQVLDPALYKVTRPSGPKCDAGFVLPGKDLPNLDWPGTQAGGGDVVRIRFRAGYGQSVPSEIIVALQAAVADQHVNREQSQWREQLAAALDAGFTL